MNLYDLLEDYFVDSEDAVRTLITWFLKQIMEFEALQQSGAEKYERNDRRKAQRNGYRKRSLTTRHGTLELLKHQLREVSFQTQVFERYSRTEKALAPKFNSCHSLIKRMPSLLAQFFRFLSGKPI